MAKNIDYNIKARNSLKEGVDASPMINPVHHAKHFRNIFDNTFKISFERIVEVRFSTSSILGKIIFEDKDIFE